MSSASGATPATRCAATRSARSRWGAVLADCEAGNPKRVYEGGRVAGDSFVPARWDLLQSDKYMWGSVQTVRGCPKHCSFCSVWRTDGQKPRQRGVDAVVSEVVEL